MIDDCLKLKNKKLREQLEAANTALESHREQDHALVAIDEEMAMEGLDIDNHSSLFIGDSGASVHMSGSLAGMTNIRDCYVQVKTANG